MYLHCLYMSYIALPICGLARIFNKHSFGDTSFVCIYSAYVYVFLAVFVRMDTISIGSRLLVSPSVWITQVKVSYYIAQCQTVRIALSALRFISLTDIFNQTPSQRLWEASSLMLQLMCEGCSYRYAPLSVANYSFIQLSELEQCRMKKHVQGFNAAAKDSKPGCLSREFLALPLSHSLYH